MKTTIEKKPFAAVAASRQWKQAVAAEISDMTAAEKVAYFRSHSRLKPVPEGQLEPPKRKPSPAHEKMTDETSPAHTKPRPDAG